jgi:hypothetical protein
MIGFCPDGYVSSQQAVLLAAKLWFPERVASLETVVLEKVNQTGCRGWSASAEYKGRLYLTPEQLQAQVEKAMIPLHKQIQKYEDKLAKIKEREEKRAEAEKKNAGKADRKKPSIDRELSLAEAGVLSSLRDIFRQIE